MTGDKCECLNWKRLYEGGRHWCGEGLEFYSLSNSSYGLEKEQLAQMMVAPKQRGYSHYEHTCDFFFKNLDTNRCVNFGMFGWDPDDWRSSGQWCYVPFSCRDLNGGERLRRKPVCWRVCEEGRDELFRGMAPKNLLQFMEPLPDKALLGTAVRLSYPALRPDLWYDVRKKWRLREFKRMPLMLQSALRHNVPIVIETLPPLHSLFAPKKILYNGTLWALICMNARTECLQKEDEYGPVEL
eukprot:CAMPEP_0171080110 /NCGR_PEP_ID=MMETSP0766_2-20121228/15667_1 /TAXON_ID=439317 /ORGANISM="Gambierdiscus australes, Strain CAWD 149" /LENGTH=240 /DNA_ID=CAMNT_0011537325 /DNA_START=120 /DNA_END=842 /DNA_ORIENTATION=+